MTRAILGAATAALLLAGCASYLPVNGQGDRTALPPAAKQAATPSPSPTPQAYAPPAAPAGSHDTCGAAALQYLVGKNRTEIPVPTDLARRRVVCTTCPVTQDFRPDRQTITYDAATGNVVGVRCG
ncbi:MAG: peptidase inhibitor I78 [Caulobacteraceae bacterium]|nr:peptidase inhibitor I78 [Caulobacter sp.]